jgi:hypothetical protein
MRGFSSAGGASGAISETLECTLLELLLELELLELLLLELELELLELTLLARFTFLSL